MALLQVLLPLQLNSLAALHPRNWRMEPAQVTPRCARQRCGWEYSVVACSPRFFSHIVSREQLSPVLDLSPSSPGQERLQSLSSHTLQRETMLSTSSSRSLPSTQSRKRSTSYIGISAVPAVSSVWHSLHSCTSTSWTAPELCTPWPISPVPSTQLRRISRDPPSPTWLMRSVYPSALFWDSLRSLLSSSLVLVSRKAARQASPP